ncbi:MAG: ATP-binding cassette domain-containing protein [Gulosibacter sp.]|uniref:ATP-binding cassette domain-containing protein n=1 Tax=Gulosibacter sp. TaxID=2817531 RepID=UPI003F929BAE
MISTKNLKKTYRGTEGPALDGIAIDIKIGGITAILGPNGSGKTTLLQMLAGQLEPDEGEVRIGDHRVSTDDRIPYFAVAHEGNNFGEMRMRDLLVFARSRPNWNEQEYQRLAKRFEIPKPRKQISKLSTGQQSAFALILAIAAGAPVLIVDEAHAGMDVPKRLALYEELVRVNAEDGRTILIASHNVGELERVVEDVIILNRGKVVEASTADAIARRFARIIGPHDAVQATAGTRTVRSARRLGPTEEWTVDVSNAPLDHPENGVVVTPVEFQDAFVALIEDAPNELRKERTS